MTVKPCPYFCFRYWVPPMHMNWPATMIANLLHSASHSSMLQHKASYRSPLKKKCDISDQSMWRGGDKGGVAQSESTVGDKATTTHTILLIISYYQNLFQTWTKAAKWFLHSWLYLYLTKYDSVITSNDKPIILIWLKVQQKVHFHVRSQKKSHITNYFIQLKHRNNQERWEMCLHQYGVSWGARGNGPLV